MQFIFLSGTFEAMNLGLLAIYAMGKMTITNAMR